MNSSLAYRYDPPGTERIGGQEVVMSPRPLVNHTRVSSRIYRLLADYLEGKPCEAFPDGIDLYLTDDDWYVPDGMVVCDGSKVHEDGIYGAPDLVIEVLSPRTARYDRGRKLEAYGASGVREYWIVDADHRTIEQYVLEDGRLKLLDMYTQYSAFDWGRLDEEERAEVETEFRCTLFDDLTIQVAEVFQDLPPRKD